MAILSYPYLESLKWFHQEC